MTERAEGGGAGRARADPAAATPLRSTQHAAGFGVTGAGDLTPKKRRALVALLSEPTLEAAAAAARVGVRTLRTWRSERAFAAALEAAAADAFEHALARVRGLASEAVETLRGVMLDPLAPASARVSAARTVLERADRDAPRPDGPPAEPEPRPDLSAWTNEELEAALALSERINARLERETQ
jgi:hypothetical protein